MRDRGTNLGETVDGGDVRIRRSCCLRPGEERSPLSESQLPSLPLCEN